MHQGRLRHEMSTAEVEVGIEVAPQAAQLLQASTRGSFRPEDRQHRIHPPADSGQGPFGRQLDIRRSIESLRWYVQEERRDHSRCDLPTAVLGQRDVLGKTRAQTCCHLLLRILQDQEYFVAGLSEQLIKQSLCTALVLRMLKAVLHLRYIYMHSCRPLSEQSFRVRKSQWSPSSP